MIRFLQPCSLIPSNRTEDLPQAMKPGLPPMREHETENRLQYRVKVTQTRHRAAHCALTRLPQLVQLWEPQKTLPERNKNT